MCISVQYSQRLRERTRDIQQSRDIQQQGQRCTYSVIVGGRDGSNARG